MIQANLFFRSLAVLTVFLSLTVGTLPTSRGLAAAGHLNRPGSSHNRKEAKPFPRSPSQDALKWADKELSRMSIEQKIGQLISVGVNATFLNQDSDAFRELKRQVEENHIGGIILFRGSVYESVFLVNRMQQFARYPLLVSADLEGSGKLS